jgi:hypothetical protein
MIAIPIKRCIQYILVVALLLQCTEACKHYEKGLEGKKLFENEHYMSEEGDIYSRERWVNIKKNINGIKRGMAKRDIIEILGFPDGLKWTPSNIIQYSVAYGVMGDGKSNESIHIVLELNKVVEIREGAFVYGPPPQSH